MTKQIENIVNHAEVSEKSIEKYLVERVEALGGMCLKYHNPNQIGFPDRICLLPDGKVMWVELKSRGEKLRTIQEIRFNQLARLGQIVHVCDSKHAIDAIMEPLKQFRP